MQCKLKLCTQKYCIGSQKLRPRSWMWLCILIFQNTTSSKPACVFFGCFFLSVYICLFHQLQLHFSCKHTRAREDGDVKWCLTNILLRRHLILISWPRVPGAMEVYFKAEHHIEIFSTRLTLTCRANRLWISVCFLVCVRGLRSWCRWVGGVYVNTKLSFYPCTLRPSTVWSRIKVSAVSDCIITGANLTPIQPRVIREDIILTLCLFGSERGHTVFGAELVDTSVKELWMKVDNLDYYVNATSTCICIHVLLDLNIL